MSKLKAIDPKAAEPSKPKILIFGKPGVGKTWASLDFPKVYYIDTEGGADLAHYTAKLKAAGGMYFGPDQGALDFAEVIGQIQALATETHGFKTVVIDSFTKIFNLAVASEAERLGDKNSFGADKKPAIAQTRRLVNWLARLDMNVVIVCHEKPQWGLDASGARTETGVTFDAWDKLEYELHLCLNIQKNGPNRFAKVRKSRLEAFKDGASFPWSYTDFAKLYGQDVIERETEKLVIATPDQVAEITRLLDVVKVDPDFIEKCLTKAGASELAELSADQADKIISNLKGRIK